MNNLYTLFSLIRGRRNLRFLNMFGNRRRNNGGMILWSLIGLMTLGVIGSRNTKWGQKMQEGYNDLRNNTRIPFQNQLNFGTEFAEEATPKNLNNQ